MFLILFLFQSGALLALGIVNCGVRNDCDPALALLSDYVLHESVTLRIGAVLGSIFFHFSNRVPSILRRLWCVVVKKLTLGV